ncbi:MAG: tryptophan synthase subunit alpha [Lentisphaeria bacterium]
MTQASPSIEAVFDACRRDKRKALVVYVTGGDPSLAFTERLLPRLAAAGADIIELGVPFSDPMADGPVIQAASQRALAGGASLDGLLAMLKRLKGALTAPLVLFSYYNVLLQYGVDRLARDSAAAGVAGWLVVDLPAEEAAEVAPELERAGLCRIPLVAPTTPPDRLPKVLAGAAAGGFVYYITVTGVTGARRELPPDLADNLQSLRRQTALPVVAGFGVASPETARQVAAHADGVVVGSALVKLMADQPDDEARIAAGARFVGSLAAALR